MTPGADSHLLAFLAALMAEGRAVVSSLPLEPASPESAPEARCLAELEARSRADLPGEPPEFSETAALWAARLLYHLCQIIVCREIGEAEIKAVFTEPCPAPRGPATDWSADLLLRHLPVLFRLAKQLSNADPLLLEMKTLAGAWPLSSVGIPGLDGCQLDSFISHPALARLYADRIIATTDLARLGNPRVEELLRTAIGIHHDLAPELASRLFPKEEVPLAAAGSVNPAPR